MSIEPCAVMEHRCLTTLWGIAIVMIPGMNQLTNISTFVYAALIFSMQRQIHSVLLLSVVEQLGISVE